MAALTNAQRQAAYRTRNRNGGSGRLGQAVEVTEQPMERAVQQFHWGRQIAAGKCNPYQLHVMRCRYGVDWVHQCVTK